ncbi:MAG: hypothetical protein HOG34_22455 [Bacteroidetes bacterium]|nr:hypothetical protein [Bacteroidota bacterium]MBT4401308.1 hypothetical protein [Bacteroidota bacterium]MBT4409494.1 hypothetical protein [Bacteroidota bacterium]MBT7465977.1 hypothetical protein [Bacteroidota bacterium]
MLRKINITLILLVWGSSLLAQKSTIAGDQKLEYFFGIGTTRIEFSPFIGTGVGASFWSTKNNTGTKLKPRISSAFTFIIGGRLPSRSKITQNIQIEFNYSRRGLIR